MTRTSMTFAVGLPLALMLALLTTAPVAAQAAATASVVLPTDRTVLPLPEPQYPHSTVFDARNATPPPRFEVKAPANAPNVLIVLIDDMGFGQSSAFGGPIHMPTVERLANAGLRYNEFHTTALCSPTRTALLSGRNHHMNNYGSIAETATAFPGQTGQRPNSVAPLAEMLRLNGYSTAAFGKSHETAAWEVSPSGPTDRWPTRSGFDKFYGFIGGETNQWAPAIYEDMSRIELPKDPNYHLMTDMTNQAIKWVSAQKALTPDRPFFTYFAPGATRAPHHVPKEWIAKYKGQFDQGWDKVREETLARQIKLGVVPAGTKLAPKPEAIKDWATLDPDEKKLFARQMEVFAGFGEYADTEIGRLIQAIEATGQLDNTLIFYIVGDIGPTILEAAGLPEPKSVNGTPQTPIEGVSLAYTFADTKTPSRHTTQYFEIFGNRAIYQDGWLAGTVHRAAWEFKPRTTLENDKWELYDTRSDFSLANDLAANNPGKLKEMQDLFLKEAVKYQALPLDDRTLERLNAALVGRPDLMAGRTSLTVHQGMTGMSENVFINVKNRSHTITAEVEIPKNGANGVIIAQAGRFGGWSLYLKDGKPTYTYNWLGLDRYTITAKQALPAGKGTIRFEFAYDGGGVGKGGVGTISFNGKPVATGHIDRTQCCVYSADEGADVGADEGTPVTEAYKVPFKFTGKIGAVTIELNGMKKADNDDAEQARKSTVLKKALAD